MLNNAANEGAALLVRHKEICELNNKLGGIMQAIEFDEATQKYKLTFANIKDSDILTDILNSNKLLEWVIFADKGASTYNLFVSRNQLWRLLDFYKLYPWKIVQLDASYHQSQLYDLFSERTGTSLINLEHRFGNVYFHFPRQDNWDKFEELCMKVLRKKVVCAYDDDPENCSFASCLNHDDASKLLQFLGFDQEDISILIGERSDSLEEDSLGDGDHLVDFDEAEYEAQETTASSDVALATSSAIAGHSAIAELNRMFKCNLSGIFKDNDNVCFKFSNSINIADFASVAILKTLNYHDCNVIIPVAHINNFLSSLRIKGLSREGSNSISDLSFTQN